MGLSHQIKIELLYSLLSGLPHYYVLTPSFSFYLCRFPHVAAKGLYVRMQIFSQLPPFHGLLAEAVLCGLIFSVAHPVPCFPFAHCQVLWRTLRAVATFFMSLSLTSHPVHFTVWACSLQCVSLPGEVKVIWWLPRWLPQLDTNCKVPWYLI